jgi:hypothetical protein
MSAQGTVRTTILEPLFPTLLSICIAFFLSFLLQANPTSLVKIQPFSGTGILRDAANALFFVCLGSLLMLAIYILFEKTGMFFRRVIIVLLISPTIFVLTIFFGQTILMAFFKNNPNLLLSFLTLFTIYLSIFSAILILTDALSEKVRNIILLFYGSSLGTFLGFSIPTISTIFLLLVIGIEDYLIIGRFLSKKAQEAFDSGIHGYFGLAQRGFKIGIGELVLCPVLIAHSLTNYGVEVCIASIILLLLGFLLNLLLAQTKKGEQIFPGLLLPTILGIIPLTITILIL